MQSELDAESTDLPIQLIGINGIGHDSANADMVAGRDLPWLQDTAQTEVWTSWNVGYRDVVILGADGKRSHVYNLTSNDLGNAGNFAQLKQLLIDLASGTAPR